MEKTIIFNAFEKVFVVTSLLMFTGAIIPLLYQSIQELIYLGIYIVVFLLVLIHFRVVFLALFHNKLLASLIVITIFSVLWSVNPSITSQRIIAMLGTTLFGIYLGVRYPLNIMMNLLAWVFGLSVVLCYIFAIFFPAYGVGDGLFEGMWRGIYAHKNNLGLIMVLSSIIFLLQINLSKYKLLAFLFFILSVMLLLFSQSTTAQMVLVLVMLVVIAIKMMEKVKGLLIVPATVVFLLFAGVLTFFYINHWDETLESFGKEATFTGRTVLWQAVMYMIEQRPWLGYGYGAFWLGMDGSSSYIWSIIKWAPAHAHNGYLDLCLHIGFFGFLIFCMGVVLHTARSARLYKKERSNIFIWPICILVVMISYNFSESIILRQNNIFWILYVATVISVWVNLEATKSHSANVQYTVIPLRVRGA